MLIVPPLLDWKCIGMSIRHMCYILELPIFMINLVIRYFIFVIAIVHWNETLLHLYSIYFLG